MPQMIKDATENPRGFGGTPDPELGTNEDGEVQATEEEQQNYEMLVIRGRKIMFGKGKENILKMLGSSETPAQGIGKVGSMLLKSLVQSAKQQGREIGAEVALNAAPEIAEDLNDLAKVNKVFQYDSPEDEEKELADAMLWGVKYYGDGMISANEITPEMQSQAREQVRQGIAEEQAAGPKKTPIAAAVGNAVNQPPGIVGGAAGGGY